MSQAQAVEVAVEEGEVIASPVPVKVHKAKAHYKTFAAGTKGFESLEAMLKEQKLKQSDIDVGTAGEGAEAKVTWKRKSAELTVTVPLVAGLVQPDLLTANQIAHLQSVVDAYFEGKQRPYVDAASTEVVNWSTLLEGPYSLKTAAVKITAEMVNAAVAALAKGLAGITPAKAATTVVELAKKKFSTTICRDLEVPILEKINSLVVEVFDSMTAEEQAQHEAVFELFVKELADSITPPAPVELSLEDFAL